MKFITSTASLNHEFKRLLGQYRHLDWAVAWATNQHAAFDLLLKHRRKIRRVVIGTHFHQTAPEFIDAFRAVPEVRFRIDQEGLNGVFHPKLYLFSDNASDWEVIIGSANFTAGAFKRNTEHAVLISSTDKPDGMTYAQLVEEVEQLWQKGRRFKPAELEAYRLRWAKNRTLLDHAAGHDSGQKRGKSIYDRELLSLPWPDFYKTIRNKKERYFNDRITILRETKKIWAAEPSFAKLTTEDRKKISGTASEKVLKWRLFGSNKGALKLKTELRDENKYLLSAVDKIPLKGDVRKSHYTDFIGRLSWAFDQNKEFGGLGVASRLLCFRRPDYFLCVNKKNRDGLYHTLGVSEKDVTVDTYWDMVVAPLIDTPWWQSDRPSGNLVEQTVWSGRIAMIDSLFYEGHS